MTTVTCTRTDMAAPSAAIHHYDESDNLPVVSEEAVAMMAFMACVTIEKETDTAVEAGREESRMQLDAYLRNKYGDEYADVDGLGFETSRMGLRADHNHIF